MLPHNPRAMQRMSPRERFEARVVKTSYCWLWTGKLTEQGYARFSAGHPGRKLYVPVHRWAYEEFVGPIPDGYVIDHLCRVKHCVNPAHLEAVTPSTNTKRGLRGAPTSHCKNGHEFTPDNTRPRPDGAGRECITCRRASWRAHYHRKAQMKEQAA